MDMDMSNTTSSSNSPSMHMYFTSTWTSTPILFHHFVPTSSAHIFGIWLLMFTTAILYRGLHVLREHLEETYWRPHGKGVQPFNIVRDGGRALITFVTATVGYGLMLVVMSFVVAYFFAVVTGLAVGELVWARLERGRRVLEHH